MRTIEVKLFSFDELSEDVKERVINSFCEVNVDYKWWDGTFYDAENVGIKITGFDLDRSRYCSGEFYEGALSTAYKILSEHGENCETYKDAKNFISERDALVEKYSDNVTLDRVAEENEYEFDTECDELEEEFLKTILEDYSLILQHEYEYLTSEEAIIETIKANDYEFTEDGKLA